MIISGPSCVTVGMTSPAGEDAFRKEEWLPLPLISGRGNPLPPESHFQYEEENNYKKKLKSAFDTLTVLLPFLFVHFLALLPPPLAGGRGQGKGEQREEECIA